MITVKTITVDLVARTASFVEGMDKAGQIALTNANNIKRAFNAIGTGVVSALAGVEAALAAMVDRAVEGAAKLYDVAQSAGISVAALSALDYAPAPQAASQASSLGNEQWWQAYQDPGLTQLIHSAIAKNYDVRIAAARVLEAQAQVGITRSDQLPSANVGADIFSQQNSKVTTISRLSGQCRRTEPIGDLESGFLGEISPSNRGGSCPITRNRVGTASGAVFAGR